jgi:taurine dioxygenase
MTTPSSIRLLTPTGSALGAVVQGVDASGAVSAEALLALEQGLLDHHILIFKGQDLSEQPPLEGVP